MRFDESYITFLTEMILQKCFFLSVRSILQECIIKCIKFVLESFLADRCIFKYDSSFNNAANFALHCTGL